MIRNIIELLRHSKVETENIRIAQGRYKMPETIKEGYKQLKQEIWQRKSI